MIVALKTNRGCVTYVAYNLYAVTGVADAEAIASQNFPVAQGVKLFFF